MTSGLGSSSSPSSPSQPFSPPHVPFLYKGGGERSTTITPAATTLFKITDRIKELIRASVDNNKTNAAIVIGLVDPNGTQFYGYGKMSATNKTTVDQNTIFRIGSITKVFTTILPQDMVDRGLVKS